MRDQRLRAACFTLNSPKIDDYGRLYDLFNSDICRYGVVGEEYAPTTGTKHLQGYVALTKKLTFETLKTAIGTSAHIEPAKGSARQNQTYCIKDGNFAEYGDIPLPGKRSDLDSACAAIKLGKRNHEIANEFPSTWVRYAQGLKNLRMDLLPPFKRDVPNVRVYVGPKGTGKSTRAEQEASALGDIYYKMCATGQWWPGYEGQPAVVFNDFYGGMKYSELLQLLDRFGGEVQIKGSSVPVRTNDFWFTSNKSIHQWYPNITDTSALARRITIYERMDSIEGEPIVLDPFNMDPLASVW